MWELSYEIEKLFKSLFVNYHRSVLLIKKNAVLIVVNIGGILEAPFLAADVHGDNSVILSCGVIYSACIAHIFRTEEALGIAALLCVLCGGNCLGVLFGLGEVYGDVKLAVFGVGFPLDVLCDTVAADIVGVTAEFIEIVRCLYGRFLIIRSEFADDL